MRKILTILASVLLLAGTLTSCTNLNKEMSYTFCFNYLVDVQDETAEEELSAYITEHFVKRPDLPSYFGRLSDVSQRATEYFTTCLTKEESDYIQARIQDPEDTVLIQGVISGQYGDCLIGTIYWVWRDDQQEQ